MNADSSLTLPGLRAKHFCYPAFTARYCTRRERQARSRSLRAGWVIQPALGHSGALSTTGSLVQAVRGAAVEQVEDVKAGGSVTPLFFMGFRRGRSI